MRDLKDIYYSESKGYNNFPFPATVANEPHAILTFLLPAQGILEENNFEDLVMWSVAPEYNTQVVLESIIVNALVMDLPDWTREEDELDFSKKTFCTVAPSVP